MKCNLVKVEGLKESYNEYIRIIIKVIKKKNYNQIVYEVVVTFSVPFSLYV